MVKYFFIIIILLSPFTALLISINIKSYDWLVINDLNITSNDRSMIWILHLMTDQCSDLSKDSVEVEKRRP